MKLAVISNCAIDTIVIDGTKYEQIGGAGCYCSLAARQFNFDVDLYSRFGPDFPTQYLSEAKVNLIDCQSGMQTTRFLIDIDGADRTLFLQEKCDHIRSDIAVADAHLVSPIYDEVTAGQFEKIKADSSFLLVDPQGFLRQAGSKGRISLHAMPLDLSGVDAIKVNPEEASCMVNGTHDEMMLALQKKGAKHVLLADKADVSLLVKDKVYSITLPNKEIHDTTGVGDIFCAAFCCTMLKERDFLWALCFAGGAAQAALDSKKLGLQKIPRRGTIQTNASYFYNLVKFRDV